MFFSLFHHHTKDGQDVIASKKHRRAFSAVEMLVVVGIGVIVTGISLSAFTRFKKGNQVDRSAEQIASLLKTARYQTLAARDGAFYGVKLASSTVTLFPNGYVASSTRNTPLILDGQVIVSGASLSPSTTTITFARLTGEASASGTLTVSFRGNSAVKRIITIHRSGLVE